MVIGNISEIQAGECKYPAAIQKALHFLAEHDFAKMQDGKYPMTTALQFCSVIIPVWREKASQRPIASILISSILLMAQKRLAGAQ